MTIPRALSRVPVASAIFLALLVGAALGRGGGYFWPLVAFPMYSYLDPSRPRTFLIEGITESGASFPLSGDRFFRPYLRQDLLFRLARTPRAELAPLASLALRLYERGRTEGRHDGPPLRGLRISAHDLRNGERTPLFESGTP